MQYFRVPASQWQDSIRKLRDAGCNTIASYVPWSWHEPRPGAVDFTGETHPTRNVLRFLDLVRDAGMVFVARPGPFIYAEYRGFGYPDWLALEIPEALARRANGRPASSAHFHIYSLLHPAYLARVEEWYFTVARALAPYWNNPVVGWQLDNETGMPFTIRIGDLDFNADTVLRYRRYLRVKYEDEELLAGTWGHRKVSFDTALPPGHRSAPVELTDWQEFLETWIAGYLQKLSKITRDAGVPLPLAVNEPGEYLSPQNPRLKAQGVTMYGYDTYAKVTGSAHTTDFPWISSHHPIRFRQFARDDRPLTCWELGTGWWDWRAKVSNAATLQTLCAGIAHGLAGYNLYTAQDGRDPGDFPFHFRGLLDEDGNPTERLAAVEQFQRFLEAHEPDLLESEEVFDSVGFLDYQPYTRLAPDDCLPLGIPGLLEPLRYFAKWGFAGLHAVLQTAGYNVPFIDLLSATPEELAAYRALIFPSRGYLGGPGFEKLLSYTRRGGNLVTFPEPATHQLDGAPLDWQALWPVERARDGWHGRAELISHLITRWIVPYYLKTRWKTARISPGALHLSDLIEPALVGQSAQLPSVSLEAPVANGKHERLDGDFRLVCFRNGGEVMLRHRDTSAGYRVPVGKGTSTVLGTVLGGGYTTSRYYALKPERRAALRRFAVRLLEPLVQRHVVPDAHLEVETIVRRLPDGGCFLFVLNRLGRQAGALRFPNFAALGLADWAHAEVAYSAFGSTARKTADGLALDLQPDDVLVARLS